ncbi:MAG: hypothetical protein MUC62_06035 [Candidatus Thermoplasmatota archaeon]|jgi:DNA-binding MarR family transcriptional regulator|nr:hypothetical protein [Candidatus Thermoplasmatota archaeon]
MHKKISMTVDERVLLHLMDFIPFEEDFESPEGTTQAGIAKGVAIERKHIPRAVKKLITDSLVETKVSHVKGARQRKKVYFLTFEGKALARRIWESLAKKQVIIRDESGNETETTFSELCFTFQVGRTPLQLLQDFQDGNVYSPTASAKQMVEKEPRRPSKDGRVDGAKEVYRKALVKAWEDSILTKEESQLLKELRDSLGITELDHRNLQEEILGSGKEHGRELNRSEIYRKVLEVAVRDGRITQDEQDILDELERSLGLNTEQAMKLRMEMQLLKGEGIMTPEKRDRNYRDIYGSVIRESMKDGKISRDEQNLILLLKRLLEIEDKEHLDIYNEMKGS